MSERHEEAIARVRLESGRVDEGQSIRCIEQVATYED